MENYKKYKTFKTKNFHKRVFQEVFVIILVLALMEK
jgi:hypothetical protein